MSDLTPSPERPSRGSATGTEAYLRVRVTGEPRRDGSMLVYLPNGTGLVVRSDQLRVGMDTSATPHRDR